MFFKGATATFTGFTNGAGQIWLDEVQCTGAESRLTDCPARPVGEHNCGHWEDAGVRCRVSPGAYNVTFVAWLVVLEINGSSLQYTIVCSVQIVTLAHFALLVGHPGTMVVLKSTSTVSGAQCVTTFGTI